MSKIDTYQEVTDRIIAALEGGAKPWRMDWSAGAVQMPHRATGQAYRGINVLLLWMAAHERRLTGKHWLTFKQAQAMGANVRKGERGTRIVFLKQLNVERENAAGQTEEHRIPMLRAYTVFNSDQVDNLPASFAPPPLQLVAGLERDRVREATLRACGATINEGGNRAFYNPAADEVTMPAFDLFESTGGYLVTLAHELCHWTGHSSRLDRGFGPRSKADYAREELVAELGAAFIGARLGIAGDHLDNHAAYLANWLEVLREDKRAIFRAASAAQAAADWVLGERAAASDGQEADEALAA